MWLGPYPFEAIDALKAAGYFAAPVPLELGGLGVSSAHDLVVASSRLARGDAELEWRLHPVARYQTPGGLSHYDVWESVVAALAQEATVPLPRGLAGLERDSPVHDDVVDPDRVTMWILVRRRVHHARRIEHDEIRPRTFTNDTAIVHARTRCGQRGHLANGVLQREDLLVARGAGALRARPAASSLC